MEVEITQAERSSVDRSLGPVVTLSKHWSLPPVPVSSFLLQFAHFNILLSEQENAMSDDHYLPTCLQS